MDDSTREASEPLSQPSIKPEGGHSIAPFALQDCGVGGCAKVPAVTAFQFPRLFVESGIIEPVPLHAPYQADNCDAGQTREFAPFADPFHNDWGQW
jgi:hypothetical protein